MAIDNGIALFDEPSSGSIEALVTINIGIVLQGICVAYCPGYFKSWGILT